MKSASPIIGITTYAPNDELEFTLPRDYVDCVRRAGGIPLLLPPGEKEYFAYLSICDAFLLAGGGDIGPAVYGGPSHETIYMVDDDRDQMEIALAEALLGKEIPTLAICRGIQIINVALGGSLFPHVPDKFGEEISHRAPPRKPIPHSINVLANSRLAGTLKATRIEAASWHHQAIDRLGKGLAVVALAPDGVIEAVELPGNSKLIAVQWHPEITAQQDATQQRLFEELVKLAKER